jgi:cytochrome c-type biogenesis protein CcmE
LTLKTEVDDSRFAGRVAVGPAPRVRSRRSLLGSRRRQVVAGVVIVAAIGFLVFEGLGNALSYYQTVPQALAQRQALGVKYFRIMGTVGAKVSEVDHETVFDISYQGKTVSVVDSADPPQLFRPGIPVVLQGHFAQGSDVFDSDLIMVKHSANYVPAKGEPKSVAAQTGGS